VCPNVALKKRSHRLEPHTGTHRVWTYSTPSQRGNVPNAWRIGLLIAGLVEHWSGHPMSSNPPTATDGEVPQGLHTAEEIAEVLKVDPKTVLNWAKAGIIPEAFRVGRTVRFSLEAVKASLDVNCTGDGRSVELAALALKRALGDDFPKLSNVDPGSITMDESAEINRLCAIHAAAIEDFKTPQERFSYAEGALEAARMLARGA